jgi:hypothetical protein
VLGDIGDPELVRVVSVELPLNAIGCGGDSRDAAELGPARDALYARSTHQEFHRLVSDLDTLSQRQLSMNVSDAIGAPRGEMRSTDQFGQPGVLDRSHRGRP